MRWTSAISSFGFAVFKSCDREVEMAKYNLNIARALGKKRRHRVRTSLYIMHCLSLIINPCCWDA